MDTVPLSATARAADAVAPKLRSEDQVPCVLYGYKIDGAQSLQCEAGELRKAYIKAGESTIVELDAAGNTVPVLFHSVDFDPVTEEITHVDFYAVNMDKEIEARVPIDFQGEAPAVKDLGGVLLTVLDHATVICLPKNLPHSIEVSLEGLVDFHTTLTIADLQVPEAVTIKEEAETVIATAQEVRATIEAEPAEGEEGEEGEGGGAAEGGEGGEEGGEEKAEEGGE